MACWKNLADGMKPRVAVIGGGWAGCAAGLRLAEAGIEVSLFEAGMTLGGRARAVEINGLDLDNGQHILLGAYTQTLELITSVSNPHQPISDAGLLRLPLVLDQAPDFLLRCPRLPAPLHLLAGLLGARGLSLMDKIAALRWVHRTLKNSDDVMDTSVAKLIADQSEKVRTALWQPLCIAALNTAPEHASANVFKQVLAASFGNVRSHSDLLLPRKNLTRLFPQPAAQRMTELNGQIRLRTRVTALRAEGRQLMLTTSLDTATYDRVVVAVAPQHLAKICGGIAELQDIVRAVETYHYEAIATAYLQYPSEMHLSRPMLALAEGPAQFVFDRGQTHGQAGLLAVVVSAASNLSGHPQSDWMNQIERQLSRISTMPSLRWHKALLEKQASYSCRPNIPRPENSTPHPFIFLAGDYTAGDYPATLESATQSGVKSAQMLMNSL
jgi:squalene-associated FAD-dependent desaturase